jgi:hypothetical protein
MLPNLALSGKRPFPRHRELAAVCHWRVASANRHNGMPANRLASRLKDQDSGHRNCDPACLGCLAAGSFIQSIRAPLASLPQLCLLRLRRHGSR